MTVPAQRRPQPTRLVLDLLTGLTFEARWQDDGWLLIGAPEPVHRCPAEVEELGRA